MKLFRLTGRKANDYLRRNGNVWNGTTMTIRFLPCSPKQKPGLSVGTSASSRLSASAVKRNRMRRRCREALRVAIKDAEKAPCLQLLITPKPASLTCDFGAIRNDIATFLTKHA